MTARLKTAIPKLASLDIERSVAFFERLGFRRRYLDSGYAIVERDGVQLHFWLCTDPRILKETSCRIAVEGIEELFETFSAEPIIHPNGHLELKPWGVKEFSILDNDGNLARSKKTRSNMTVVRTGEKHRGLSHRRVTRRTLPR